MFDFLKRDKQKPDVLPDKRFDEDRKEQVEKYVDKSDLDSGYNAYIACYQEYIELVNQMDTALSYKVDIDRLEADHDRQDIIDTVQYMGSMERKIQRELSGEYETEGYLYMIHRIQAKLNEMLKILDLYAND
jgi:hypothetical protein